MNRVQIVLARALTALVLIAGGLLAFAPPASAAEKYLSTTVYVQEQSNWCWAAAAKSIVRFHTGSAISQCQLVKDGKKTSSCANSSGTKANVLNAVHAHSVNGGTEQKLDWTTVKGQINASRPVYSSIIWSSGGGHAHVIRGWYDTGYSYGISYINPLSSTTESREWNSYVSNGSWHTGTGLINLWH